MKKPWTVDKWMDRKRREEEGREERTWEEGHSKHRCDSPSLPFPVRVHSDGPKQPKAGRRQQSHPITRPLPLLPSFFLSVKASRRKERRDRGWMEKRKEKKEKT